MHVELQPLVRWPERDIVRETCLLVLSQHMNMLCALLIVLKFLFNVQLHSHRGLTYTQPIRVMILLNFI